MKASWFYSLDINTLDEEAQVIYHEARYEGCTHDEAMALAEQHQSYNEEGE